MKDERYLKAIVVGFLTIILYSSIAPAAPKNLVVKWVKTLEIGNLRHGIIATRSADGDLVLVGESYAKRASTLHGFA